MQESQQPKKTLKDVSHLFISTLDKRDFSLPVLSFLSVRDECSFSLNHFFGHFLLQRLKRIFILDFHPLRLDRRAALRLVSPPQVESILFPQEEMAFDFKAVSKGRNGNQTTSFADPSVLLVDFPWHRIDFLDPLVDLLDHIIFVVECSPLVMRSVLRILKACSGVSSSPSFSLILRSSAGAKGVEYFCLKLADAAKRMTGVEVDLLGIWEGDYHELPENPHVNFEKLIHPLAKKNSLNDGKQGLYYWLMESIQSGHRDAATGVFWEGVRIHSNSTSWARRDIVKPHFYERARLEATEVETLLESSPRNTEYSEIGFVSA